MAMLILLDSNYRASFRYGSRQLLPVFSESIQAKIRGAPDRTSLVSQITYCMRSSPPASKMALIFGSFENMLTGRRSEIQHFPMAVVQTEVELYAKMIRDLLFAYPSVSVFVLAPLFRSQPAWYESVYGELSNLFCSVMSHVDPARVKVVPPVDITASNLDPAGIHFDQDGQKLVLAQLLASFSDGIFVNPEQYPLVENIDIDTDVSDTKFLNERLERSNFGYNLSIAGLALQQDHLRNQSKEDRFLISGLKQTGRPAVGLAALKSAGLLIMSSVLIK